MKELISFIISALIASPFVFQVVKAQRQTEGVHGRHYHTHFIDIPNGYKYLPSLAGLALVFMLFGLKAMCLALLIVLLLNWSVGSIIFSWQPRWWRTKYIGLILTFGSSYIFVWAICLYGVLGG